MNSRPIPTNPKTIRKLHALWKKVDGRCVYCGNRMWVPTIHQPGRSGKMASVEHIVPKSKGGTNTADNLTCSCSACNTARGNLPHEDFMIVRNEPEWQSLLKRTRKKNKNQLTNAMLSSHRKEFARKTEVAADDVWRMVKRFVIQEFNKVREYCELKLFMVSSIVPKI